MTTAAISESNASVETKKGAARYLPTIARVLMGVGFFAFGLIGLLKLAPPPKNMPQAAMDFMGWMANSGYMTQLLFGTQTLVGALLLLNRFVPLALALIAPVMVNIVAYHLFLDPGGLPIALVFLAMELFLAWSYRKAFLPMLAVRVSPGLQGPSTVN